MDEIKDIVHRVIQNISEHKRSEQDHLQDLWEKILAEKERRHTRIAASKNGTLYVHVDSSARLYQLQLKKQKILRAIQKENSGINNIHFEIGKTT